MVVVALIAALAAGVAQAADYTDAADGNWTTDTTWGVVGVWPSIAGDTATISTYTVTLNTNVVAGLSTTLGGGTLWVTGTRRIDGDLAISAPSTIYLDGDTWDPDRQVLNLYGGLSGSGLLTVNADAGKWVLRGDGTGFSGGMDIQSGAKVQPLTDGGLGTGTVTVNGGAIVIEGGVDQTAANAPAQVIVNSGELRINTENRNVDWDVVMTGGQLTLRKSAHLKGTLAVNGNVEFIHRQGGDNNTHGGYVDSDMSGSGDITISKLTGAIPGQIYLTGNNSAYSGDILVQAGAWLAPVQSTSLGTGTVTVQGTLNVGALTAPMAGSPILDGGQVYSNNSVTIDSSAVVTMNAGENIFYITGLRKTLTVDGKLTGAGKLVASGGNWTSWDSNGTDTIALNNAANDYAGGTEVKFELYQTGNWMLGNLEVGAVGALGSGTVTITNSRLTTDTGTASDTVFSTVPVVNVSGGLLKLTSTENEGKINLYEGGALDVAGGSTTMTFGAAGNIHIHDGAILPEDWATTMGNTLPTAGEIEGGGKIYLGLRGSGAANPTVTGTYATDSVVRGLATLDNWPTFSGTVTDTTGAGIELYVQDNHWITLSGATLNTSGHIIVNGGGPNGHTIGYDPLPLDTPAWIGAKVTGTTNFSAMTGAKVLDFNAQGMLFLGSDGCIPGDVTVELNKGFLYALTGDAVAGTVNANEGGVLWLEKDLTDGTINAKAGSAVWMNADSRVASVDTWTPGTKGVNVVLAASNITSLPTDGSVNYLRTERNYDGYGTMTLGDNTRITVAPDFSYHKSGDGYYFVEINASDITVAGSASQGRIAMLVNADNTYLVVDSPLSFAGKTLTIGDATDFMSTTWANQTYDEPEFRSITQNGVVALPFNNEADPTRYQAAQVNVEAGIFWLAGDPYYPDPEKVAGLPNIDVADGAKVQFTTRHGHDWTVNMNFTGDGTVSYRSVGQETLASLAAGTKRTLIVAPSSDGLKTSSIAPGNSAGVMTWDANLQFGKVDLVDDDPDVIQDYRYGQLLAEVVGSGTVAGSDFDQLAVTGSATLTDGELIVTLPVPGVGLVPTTPNWTTTGDLTDFTVGSLGDMAIVSAAAVTGLFAVETLAGDDHWVLRPGATLVTYSATEAVLKGADIVWMAMPGDANLDDTADLSDLTILAGNYRKTTGQTWLGGDFNFDGAVDLSDLALLAGTYRQTNPQFPGGGGSPVPEPMTLVLLGLGGLGVIARRRRK